MIEAKKRALELVNRLEVLVPRHPNEPEEAPIFSDLRAAIQAIGASECTFLPPEPTPDGYECLTLVTEGFAHVRWSEKQQKWRFLKPRGCIISFAPLPEHPPRLEARRLDRIA